MQLLCSGKKRKCNGQKILFKPIKVFGAGIVGSLGEKTPKNKTAPQYNVSAQTRSKHISFTTSKFSMLKTEEEQQKTT